MEEDIDSGSERDNRSLIGLIFYGEDPDRSICFGVCLGIDQDNEVLEVKTLCGAPERSYFRSFDPENPRESRSLIIDVKRSMQESNRGFYVNQIETGIENLWEAQASNICDIIRNSTREEAEIELQDLIAQNLDPRPQESFTLRLVDFSEIDYETDTKESDSVEDNIEESEEDDEDNDEQPESEPIAEDQPDPEASRSVFPVSPVLDAEEGERARDLQPGVKIPVKLTGNMAQEIGERVTGDPDVELPSLPAEVLRIRTEPESNQLTLITRLSDGILGMSTLEPENSLSTSSEYPKLSENHNRLTYRKQVRQLIMILLIWLLVMVGIMMYLIIF